MLGSAESKTNEIMEKIVRDADKMTVKEAVINNLLLSNTIYNENAKRIEIITEKIEKTHSKVGEDINEIKGAILQLTGLATKVEKIVEDNETAKNQIIEMVSNIKEETDKRMDAIEKKQVLFGTRQTIVFSILGAMGLTALGFFVTTGLGKLFSL